MRLESLIPLITELILLASLDNKNLTIYPKNYIFTTNNRERDLHQLLTLHLLNAIKNLD